MGINIIITLGFILVLASLLFAAIAYNYKNKTFFLLGTISFSLSTLCLLYEYEFCIYSIFSGNILWIGMILAWGISVVFLILSQVKTNASSKKSAPVTQEYLDSIIYGEDEEWDPES